MCRATHDVEQHDNFFVESSRCGAVLKTTPTHIDEKVFEDYSAQNQVVVADVSLFWENAGDDTCAIDKCYLKAKSC